MLGLETEADLREARRRVKARRRWYAHAAAYLMVNVSLVAIWAASGDGYPWFLWALAGWGFGLACHLVVAFQPEGAAVAREAERLRTARHRPGAS